MIDPHYPLCPFSKDVVEMKEVISGNIDKPFGNHCYSCKEVNCLHNSIRI